MFLRVFHIAVSGKMVYYALFLITLTLINSPQTAIQTHSDHGFEGAMSANLSVRAIPSEEFYSQRTV
jgi:hypothetical protein